MSPDQSQDALRRTNQACENCRSLKVKCVPSDPNDLTLPCARCIKTHKQCILHQGPRKRARRSETRVAILEKKIEELSSALGQGPGSDGTVSAPSETTGIPIESQAEPANRHSSPSLAHFFKSFDNFSGARQTMRTQTMRTQTMRTIRSGEEGEGDGEDDSNPRSTESTAAANGVGYTSDRSHPQLNDTPEELDVSVIPENFAGHQYTGFNIQKLRFEMLNIWRGLVERSERRLTDLAVMPPLHGLSMGQTQARDVVALGEISHREAELRLEIFRKQFMTHYPVIDILDEVTVDELRAEQPTLFLAIMAITSVAVEDQAKVGLSLRLQNRAISAVMHDVVVVGLKTFELLLSLVLLTFWYNEPELQHNRKNHLFNTLTLSLATDLGISGQNAAIDNSKFERIVRPHLLADPRTLECRYMFVAVYCCNVSSGITVNRRMFMPQWTEYLEECCNLLEQADIPESKRQMVAFARMARLFETIQQTLDSGSEQGIPADVNEPRTQFLINMFESYLEELRGTQNHPSCIAAYHLCQVFVHQAAIHTKYSIEVGRAAFTEYSPAGADLKTTAEVVKCMSHLLESCSAIILLYTNLDVDALGVTPYAAYSRILYSSATLLKLRLLVMSNKQLAKIFPMKPSDSDLINNLIAKIDEVTTRYPFANTARLICFVLRLLCCYFDLKANAIMAADAEPVETAAQRQADNQQQVLQRLQQQQRQFEQQEQQQAYLSASNMAILNGETYGQNPMPPAEDVASPLEILSNVASGYNGKRKATDPPTTAGYAVPQPGTKATTIDAVPEWLVGEDFWKDVVPNVEAFLGFDFV